VQSDERDPVAEVVGRNDATFRDSNERINDVAETTELGQSGALIPFLCECADKSCTTIVRLTRQEYEAVRRDPALFLNAKGHDVNARGWGRVVQEFDRYSVIEKIGDAAEVAVELDPRRGVSP